MYKIVKVKDKTYYVTSCDGEFKSNEMSYNKCVNLLYKLVLDASKNLFENSNIIYDLADQYARVSTYHPSLTK